GFGASRSRHSFPTRRSSDLDEVIAGVNVKVKDASTGAYLSDGVSVTVQDGDYSELLDLIQDSDPATFSGAWERPGTYTIIVQKRSEEHTSELQSRENLVCRL